MAAPPAAISEGDTGEGVKPVLHEMQSGGSHTPDVVILLYAFVAALWAHTLGDPAGTVLVFIGILGGSVRLAINVREWMRGRK